MRKHFPVPAALLAACCLSLAALPALADPPQAKLQTRCYHVADLVVPLAQGSSVPACAEPQTLQERLSDLIVRTINPDTWSDRGGAGTIDYFPLTMSLVINQTPDVQKQVCELLNTLRRQQDVEVALEVKVVTISEDYCEQIGVNFDRDTTQKDQLGLKFLDDKQVRMLMQAAQGDSRTNVMQAPKMTLLDGQAGTFNVTEAQNFVTGVEMVRSRGLVTFSPKVEPITTGFCMTAQPVVSADRRFVQVALKINQTDLASPVAMVPVTTPAERSKGQPSVCTQHIQQPKLTTMVVETTVEIPDGGTVVFGGLKKLSEIRQEFGPPILSKVPYANRLFKNVAYGKDQQTVLFMVTPRIIINEQEKYKVAAPPACSESKQARSPCCQGSCPVKEARTCPMRATSACPVPSYPQPEAVQVNTEANQPSRVREQIIQGSPVRVSMTVEAGLSQLGCFLGRSREIEDTIRIDGRMPNGEKFALFLWKPKGDPGVGTVMRVKWEKNGDDVFYDNLIRMVTAESVAKEPSSNPHARILAKLLQAYDRACDEGQTDEAKKLARAALSLDPTCFHGKR